MSLAELLYEKGKVNPEKVFLNGDRTLTYEQAINEVYRFSTLVSPGETIVHLMFNSTMSVTSYLGIYWAGGKVVAVDPLTSAEDLRFILEDSNPSLVFTDNEIANREKEVLKGYKIITEPPSTQGFMRPYSYREDEVGLIYYYAGIAGKTMQVLHSAKRVELNAASLYRAINIKGISTVLTVPVAHVLGNSVLGVSLEDGGQMYIMKKFDVKALMKVINENNVNYLATVPMIYDALNSENGRLDPLKICVSSAAPLFPQTIKLFKEKYGKDIVQQYGFTEGLVMTYQDPMFASKITIGKPLPEVEIKVIKNDGKDANPGETGELWVKAPWIMLGYKDVEESVKVFENGWLKTGDLVAQDEEGLLYFKGIKKRMLKYKGYPIFPRDLEDILITHPDVAKVLVVGEDAGNAGVQPVAKVVVKKKRDGLETELLNYVNSKVAFYKRLKRVYIVDKLE
ncbi:class I adenylate-forming enzyme family protein [Acidianus sp. RZ1]|uniref:class I adenylate-forming enzyme family protein n=1 Tax=Acidianus sp. RZ1 TaxID=1540082 RepID=UPI001491F063|nr:class I adenylate-forming enzyme family protein [Acidianus sp. RZ1]